MKEGICLNPYVLTDNNYYKEGFIIIEEKNDYIIKYLKISIFDNELYIQGYKKNNNSVIEFSINKTNSLYSILDNFYSIIKDNKIYSQDKDIYSNSYMLLKKEKDNITLYLNDSEQRKKDFININIKDKYQDFLSLINDLATISLGSTKEHILSKIIK